jgi:hypothetical protein
MRAEDFAVESVCQVLREQGVQVAARTYRAWKTPSRTLAARTVTDAVVVDATIGVRTGPDGRPTPEGLYGRDDRPTAPPRPEGRTLHRRSAHE